MKCIKGMTKDTCPYNPRLGCDCGLNLSDTAYAELEGKCHAFWLLNGHETEEWNGDGCNCKFIQGTLNCKLNPF